MTENPSGPSSRPGEPGRGGQEYASQQRPRAREAVCNAADRDPAIRELARVPPAFERPFSAHGRHSILVPDEP